MFQQENGSKGGMHEDNQVHSGVLILRSARCACHLHWRHGASVIRSSVAWPDILACLLLRPLANAVSDRPIINDCKSNNWSTSNKERSDKQPKVVNKGGEHSEPIKAVSLNKGDKGAKV